MAPRDTHSRHRRRGGLGALVVHTGESPAKYRGAVTLGLTPDRRVERLYHPTDPVFVDRSGRRRRMIRRFAVLVTFMLAALGFFLAAAMLDSPAPAPRLPSVQNAVPHP